MNEYARMKGKIVPEVASTTPDVRTDTTPARRPAPLSEAERLRVAENRRLVLTHMPELVAQISNLVKAGLIDGWRNVKSVQLLKKDLP
ncbi:hypothetical protein SAMN05216414_1402 [Nitrosovibrio sp. Nv17]|jgi:hypothetical protein|nr:hypothetical protein SAMN05216414_1402 [Nitrosovibrio sp. Nv17]